MKNKFKKKTYYFREEKKNGASAFLIHTKINRKLILPLRSIQIISQHYA